MSLLSGLKPPSQLQGLAPVRGCSQECDSRPSETACRLSPRKARDLNPAERAAVAELANLIKEGRARIIGLVRQEMLSGIKTSSQYEKLRTVLRSLPDELVATGDYEAAAKAVNECRARGVAVSVSDILICAIAIARDWPVFSTGQNLSPTPEFFPSNCTRRGSSGPRAEGLNGS
jgi:predicted nucleic acid-binding protein